MRFNRYIVSCFFMQAFQVYGIEGVFDTKDDVILKENPQFCTEHLKNDEYAKLVEGYEFEMYYSDFNGKFYEEAWYRVMPKK